MAQEAQQQDETEALGREASEFSAVLVCPLCGADTFIDWYTPCSDHPELNVQWLECNACDWKGEEEPMAN